VNNVNRIYDERLELAKNYEIEIYKSKLYNKGHFSYILLQ